MRELGAPRAEIMCPCLPTYWCQDSKSVPVSNPSLCSVTLHSYWLTSVAWGEKYTQTPIKKVRGVVNFLNLFAHLKECLQDFRHKTSMHVNMKFLSHNFVFLQEKSESVSVMPFDCCGVRVQGPSGFCFFLGSLSFSYCPNPVCVLLEFFVFNLRIQKFY